MEIIRNKKIESFLDKCRSHIQNDTKNEYIGMHVTKAEENKVRQEMKDAGFAEFQTEKENWPSLFLSVDEWEKSPYHSHVSLDMIKDDHFSYETQKVAGRELFNADCIQKDPERELNDSMILRAMDRNFEAIYLYQDSKDWMIDAPSEANTNNLPAEHAHGNILTFGLGIGYFIYMAMHNPKVTHITCIENAPEVIAMFNHFLRPQFPDSIPLDIIEGDAFQYFNEDTFSKYDYVYTDIWQSSQDGLQMMEHLLHQYLPPYEKADFWIEDSCLEVMWTLVYVYFDSLSMHHRPSINPAYKKEMDKIETYFSGINETIDDPKRLQFYMYDTETLRKIISL